MRQDMHIRLSPWDEFPIRSNLLCSLHHDEVLRTTLNYFRTIFYPISQRLSKEGDELFGKRIMGLKTAITPAIPLICLRSLFKEKHGIYGRNKMEGL